MVDCRIRKLTAGIVPVVPGKWADRVPEVASPALQEHLHGLAKSMDDRTERLAAFTTETAPAWAVSAIGPVPEDPMERLEWQHRVAPVAAYREMFGWENPEDPIGPEPANSPEARAAWHGAFAALGPVNGPDLRAEPDGRLHLMAGTYGRITAEAPRYAGKELRFVRVAARDMGLAAVRHAAEVKAALERGDSEAAARHAAREQSAREMEGRARAQEARLAPAVDAYHEWDAARRRSSAWRSPRTPSCSAGTRTRSCRRCGPPSPRRRARRSAASCSGRRWTRRATSRRRRPAEKETGKSRGPGGRAAAVPVGGAGPLAPQGPRPRARGAAVGPGPGGQRPGGPGEGWRSGRRRWSRTRTPIRATSAPRGRAVAERERDAILQPARPQIQAAPEVAERAQGRAVATAAADHEAGG